MTLTLQEKRQLRVPSAAVAIETNTDAAIYVFTDKRDRPCLIGWAGKAVKPTWHHYFRDGADRAQFVAKKIEDRKAHAARKAELKAEEAKPTTIKEGDILVSSWGYDQTNVDFYQVVKRSGAQWLTLQKIDQKSEETAWCQGTTVPIPGQFSQNSNPFRRHAIRDSVRITSYARAYPWDGRPRHWSSYA
jgi:hypothetical protein